MRWNWAVMFLFFIVVSCGQNEPTKQFDRTHLSGFVRSANGMNIYNNSSIKFTSDSLVLNYWPGSRLVNHLNMLKDTTLTDLTPLTKVYTVQMVNKKKLDTHVFLDSIIVELTKQGVLK